MIQTLVVVSTNGSQSDNDHDDDPVRARPTRPTAPVVPQTPPLGPVSLPPPENSGTAPIDELVTELHGNSLDTVPAPLGTGDGENVPAPAEGPPPTEDEDLTTSSGAVRPTTIGGGFFGWLFNSIYRPIATGLTERATTTGAVAGSIVGGFVALVYPRPAGEGSDITPDTPNVMNVRVDDDTASGEIYADGEPTGINVEPTGIDEHGIPTGYTPATDADAEALSELTGTQISVGDTIGISDAEEIEDGENSESQPITGNQELDEVLTGTIASDDGTYGLETPISKDDFEEELANIPGAKVTPHSGGGVNVDLPDGTTVTTYPQRTSSAEDHPGYSVTDRDGTVTHKGSLVGEEL